MCGLYGIMGPGVSDTDLQVLRQLARASVVRGEDGAGMLQGHVFSKHMNFTVEKSAQEIAYLMWFHEKAKGGDRSLFNSVSDNFFCGHVRAATKGKISVENSHPFELENIVGMHNGTLKEVDYKPLGEITDSELMFRDMDKEGIKPVLARLHKDSAFAVVVFDKKKREISFARNDLRPLYCTWNENRPVLYWASEYGMLDWVLRRNGIKAHAICQFTQDLIHTISPLDIKSNKRPEWRVQNIKPVVPVIPKPVEEPERVKPTEANHPNGWGKPFRSYDVPKKPTLRVVGQDDVVIPPQDNKPSPLPEQQKAKEKDQKAAATGKEGRASSKGRPTYPRARLHVNCVGCLDDMDLLAQYQGNEIGANRYLCQKCDLEYERVGKVKFLQ